MSASPKFDLDEFADSPYAAELRRADGGRFFQAPLEREFRAYHFEHLSRAVRWWQLVALLLIVVQGGLIVFESGRAPLTEYVLLFLVLLPAAGVMALIAWSRFAATWYPRLGNVLLPIVAFGAAMLIAGLVVRGRPEALAVLTSVVLAGYLLSGALFHQGIALSLLSVVGFIVGVYVTEAHLADYGYAIALLIGTSGLGAVASYGLEKTYRTLFLESALLGELAMRDGLTGLKNRRAFDEHLENVWQQGLRDKQAVALLLIDIDHFKTYNDACGHQSGDECLRRVAGTIHTFARRPLDIAARYGGEELAVVLYGSTSERTMEAAEQLRAAIERLRIDHPESPTSPFVTATIGAACVRPSGDRSPAGLVQLADEALYAAKQNARNTVRFMLNEYETLSTGRFRRLKL